MHDGEAFTATLVFDPSMSALATVVRHRVGVRGSPERDIPSLGAMGWGLALGKNMFGTSPRLFLKMIQK